MLDQSKEEVIVQVGPSASALLPQIVMSIVGCYKKLGRKTFLYWIIM